ncbi:nucleoid occlusion protein [Paenactinomyces guangxiensis]|uniref:Nucleoid occlusion protein n=1 Tax=Paenactinomyces guangxiensis TaxID=1490290 RepID=A0A7W2A7Z0_9BACL|nr:nucleoid occlusion protein [Paenactinomyces guangxiensis]MBA4494105.1 nucleoid occlusion protein [Paenactinomyces guangxiensis]MBH8591150.1 nucleoid occlusion protein [Paenactinomyces guangxiensis]
MKEPFTKFFGLAEKEQDQVKQIPVEEILPSPYQPRTIFNEERIDELCQTIRLHGVIQPIVVRRKDRIYELIAGERRLRAVKKLQIPTIPAVIREMTDSQAASAALIENLQREGLTAIEEAHAYQKLIELHDLTQESLAQRLGKGQSTVANKLRLLQLPWRVQDELLKRMITERHARALLALKEAELQLQVLNEILQRDLNVKQTEERVRKLLEKEEPRKKAKRKSYSRDLRIAVNTIRQSIKMVKQTGMEVEANEQEHEDYYQLVIRIPK